MDDIDNKIAQWAAQMPKLNTKAMGITSRVQRLAKYMNDELAKSIRESDLTQAGFDVLATLLRAGPPHSLTPNQLLDQMLITSGTMTSRIDLLERKNLVKRITNQKDRRSVSVSLTAQGLALIEKVIVQHTASQQQLVSVFTPEQQQDFEALLNAYLTKVGY